MGMEWRDFKRDLERFTMEIVPDEFQSRQIEITLYLFDLLQAFTPVDSEHAKRNWRVTMNMDIPSNELGERTQVTRYKAVTTARRVSTANIRAKLGGMMPGSKAVVGVKKENRGKSTLLWVFNNVKYMSALENGHSKQAPDGFIHIAIAATREFIKGVGLKRGSWDWSYLGAVSAIRSATAAAASEAAAKAAKAAKSAATRAANKAKKESMAAAPKIVTNAKGHIVRRKR